MPKLRIYPHRRATDNSVTWREWWLERRDGRVPLPPVLRGWDYASDETVGITAVVDTQAVLDSTGVASPGDLEILVLCDCSASQERFVSSFPLGTGVTEIDARLRLTPGRLAESVKFSAHLVLARGSEEGQSRVAHLRGARLHSSESYMVRLEGDAGRFPVEPIPFSESGIAKAPWTVTFLAEDLAASFMGSVRLLVNTEHPIGERLLTDPPDEAVGQLLRADVLRLLVAAAARDDLRVAGPTPDEDSVAHVLDAMCHAYLNRGLSSAVRLYVDDPATFDVLVHERMNPYAGFA